uniref:uncharacterized protein LOC117153431 isoform X6 n=1 Tax=Bombus vancouverensis nearcticus TaxID=2705178 RepID=UPI00143AA286|nr:uncharacterized protein LOC117153431 isoform X6 [Bombus vancouverensis nearcticus]
MYSGRRDDSKAMDTKKKRTKSSWRPNSTSESDDSSSKIVPVSKRKRIDVFDTSSSENSIPCSFICSATSASTSINDIGHEKYDPCLKFMPIVEHANRVSKLILTHASNDNTIVIKKRNENERSGAKPYIGDSYDSYMRGVGKSDKMLYVYLDERRTVKYWKKITFHIIARMVLNSYLFYKEVSKKKPMTRLEFTSSIISEIEHEWMQVKKQHMVSDNDRIFGLMKLPGRNLRQCVVCSSKINGIKRSNLICMQCKKGLHPLCLHKHVCFKNNECHDPVKP